MENYFSKMPSTKRKTPCPSLTTDINSVPICQPKPNFTTPINVLDLDDLPSNPSKRPRILSYNVNQRDEIRWHYLVKGPWQPNRKAFPQRKIGDKLRRFVTKWYKQYSWIEYSEKADKAYCLCCYLFRDHVDQQAGNE